MSFSFPNCPSDRLLWTHTTAKECFVWPGWTHNSGGEREPVHAVGDSCCDLKDWREKIRERDYEKRKEGGGRKTGDEEKRGALTVCTSYTEVSTGRVGVKDSLSKGRSPLMGKHLQGYTGNLRMTYEKWGWTLLKGLGLNTSQGTT